MKLPIGVQDFEKLRLEGYTYVDKTPFIHRLAHGGNTFFLSRPRRFGKSLLLSTMRAFFEGKRELFHGLAIERMEQEWTCYPVLYLDLNTGKYTDSEELDEVLNRHLSAWEKEYGITAASHSLGVRFGDVVQKAYDATGKQVVVLVDEYDKPLFQTLNHDDVNKLNRDTLKAFYSVLKSQDRYIRFAFLTGVTKFSKVSIFSDLNSPEDITMSSDYSTLCGITPAEVEHYFAAPVDALAAAYGISHDEAINKLRNEYDGYHFADDMADVYNPFSLLNALKSGKVENYWFRTGTPAFLVDTLQRLDLNIEQLKQSKAKATTLSDVDSYNLTPIPLLYQTGYLTLKSYDRRFNSYTLGYPNHEVEQSLIEYLLPRYVTTGFLPEFIIDNFVDDIANGRTEQFMRRLKAFFDGNDYRVAGNMEVYFQNALYLLFRLMGFYTEVERATSMGRTDVAVFTERFIYLFEIKLDGSAEQALEQINLKQYATPYALDSRRIVKVGVNFSSATRSIERWIVE